MRGIGSRPAVALLPALALACAAAWAEPQRITVTGTASHPVEKSYRRMVRGMDWFEQHKAGVAPEAGLRFKLLPRRPGTDLQHIDLEVIGKSFDREVEVAPDQTFVLPRDPRAIEEDAAVVANRRRLTLTWRAEIRTPGGPAGTRRLGDLRLECAVGHEAGLISNSGPISRIAELFTSAESYCGSPESMYLFFSERPLFGVTLVSGTRRESVPLARLYAMAADDRGLKDDLPYCDCEVLVDRTYFLPLGDKAWPDDTRVEYEYMDSAGHQEPLNGMVPGRSTKAEVAARWGAATRVDFDSGWSVWAYRRRDPDGDSRKDSELVLLFDPAGVLRKLRLKPPVP